MLDLSLSRVRTIHNISCYDFYFSYDIGLIGLAVMGQNLVLNMLDHGFKVRKKFEINNSLGMRS